MKKIRYGMFETNSSSIHTIVIPKKCKLVIPKEIDFTFGKFGWENSVLKSLQIKANYLYTAIVSSKDREKYLGLLQQFLKKKGIRYTFEEYTLEDNYLSIEFGYIDHASDLQDFLEIVLSDEELLSNYLFSDKAFIVTGNDNGGLYEEPKPKYKAVIFKK